MEESEGEDLEMQQVSQLFAAIDQGDINAVRSMLAAGVDANAEGNVNSRRDPPLVAAAHRGDKCGSEIARLLVEAGAELDAQGDWDSTALHWAVLNDLKDDWALARF